MVRNESDSNYGFDYKEFSILKSLADKLGFAIVVVHHTRKCKDSDPFNMISGSTGISGCVDGSMVLIENKRSSRNAKLHCVGRDTENQEINLAFDSDLKNGLSLMSQPLPKAKTTFFLPHCISIFRKNIDFIGTASELVEKLKNITNEKFYPNTVTRDLVQNGYTLKSSELIFNTKEQETADL